jgi:proton glutamate symport protein
LVGRYSPRRLYRDVSPALMTAFSSASSSATLPLTMENMEQNTGVSRRITSFVLPIGATVNMDGTALYEAVAAVFIAQAYGVHLTIAQQVLVFVTASLAAVGAAAIPSAGLFTMAIVLRAVGLPLEGVALIIGVDRILDMTRTTVNVFGDVVGTVVVARMDGEKFGAADAP